jgi:hypothetical protein
VATTRFFWLPWALRSDLAAAIGTTTRWQQIFGAADNSPAGYQVGINHQQGAGQVWGETLANTPMLHYAVTTDPSRVPTTESTLSSVININSNHDYPDQPSYRYWNGSELTYSAYLATTMNDPSPDTVNDWRGPVSAFNTLKPWAFFAYEMMGVSSLSYGEFACAGYQPYQNVSPEWGKQQIGTQTTISTYWNAMSGGYQCCPASVGGVNPMIAYVLRPSTGSIVGTLAYDPLYTPRLLSSTPNWPTLPSAVSTTNTIQGWYNWGNGGNVTGIQDHDLLIWEWWHWATTTIFMVNPAVNYQGGTIQPTQEVLTIVGGGLTGQPLTNNPADGLPNWAPAHRMEGTLVTGIEPYLTGETIPPLAHIATLVPPPGTILLAQTAKLVPPHVLLPFLGGTHFEPDFAAPGVYSDVVHVGGTRFAQTVRFNPPIWTSGARRLACTANIAGVFQRFSQTTRLIPSGTGRLAGFTSFLGNGAPRFAGAADIGFTRLVREAGDATLNAIVLERFGQTASPKIIEYIFAGDATLTFGSSDRLANSINLEYSWYQLLASDATLIGNGEPRLAHTADIIFPGESAMAGFAEPTWADVSRISGISSLISHASDAIAGESLLECITNIRFASTTDPSYYNEERLASTSDLMYAVAIRLSGYATLTYISDERISNSVSLVKNDSNSIACAVRLQPTAIRQLASTSQLVGDRLASDALMEATDSARLASDGTLTSIGANALSQQAILNANKSYGMAQLASFTVTASIACTTRLNNVLTSQLAGTVTFNTATLDAIACTADLSPTAVFASDATLSPTAVFASDATLLRTPKFAGTAAFSGNVWAAFAGITELWQIAKFAQTVELLSAPRFASIATLYHDAFACTATLTYLRGQLLSHAALLVCTSGNLLAEDATLESYGIEALAGTAFIVTPGAERIASDTSLTYYSEGSIASTTDLEITVYDTFAGDANIAGVVEQFAQMATLDDSDVAVIASTTLLEQTSGATIAQATDLNTFASMRSAGVSTPAATTSRRLSQRSILAVTSSAREAQASQLHIADNLVAASGTYPQQSSDASIMMADGRVLVIMNADARIYDPSTDTLTTTSAVQNGFGSLVKLADNRIFCVPSFATAARIYTPSTDTSVLAGGVYSPDYDFSGGVLLDDGRVFLVPDKSYAIAIYNPATDTLWNGPSDYTKYVGNRAYSGGVKLNDGRVYMVANQATQALVYDPSNDTYVIPSGVITGLSGGVLLDDGRVYCVMGTGSTSVIYDPVANTHTNVGPDTAMSSNLWFSNCVKMSNGSVFCVPCVSYYAKVYDPISNTTYTQTNQYPSLYWFSNTGVLLADGGVYMPPRNVSINTTAYIAYVTWP